jgi:hypothetical protein
MALRKWTPKNFDKWFEDFFDESHFPTNWKRITPLRN